MRLPPQILQEIRRLVGTEALYWGYYWKILRLEDVVGPRLDNMSLAELASREFFVLTGILSLAFGGQHPGLSQQQSQYQQQPSGPVGPSNRTGYFQQEGLADPFQQQPNNGGQRSGLGVQGVHGSHIDPFQQMQVNGGQQFGQGFQGVHGGLIAQFQQRPASGGQQPSHSSQGVQGAHGGHIDPFQQHPANGVQQHPANGSQQFGNGVQGAYGSQGGQGGQ